MTQMTETYFEKELDKRCFNWGQGALYFKENYFETKNGTEKDPLLQVCLDTISDMEDDMEDLEEEEIELALRVLKMPLETTQQKIEMLEKFYGECYTAYPEALGAVVGALAKEGEYELAYDFIGLGNMKEDDQVPWDS
jgi:virulence-associated protein VapD